MGNKTSEKSQDKYIDLLEINIDGNIFNFHSHLHFYKLNILF